jgi:hypothetical protein
MYQYKYGNNIIYFIGESRYDLTNYQLILLPNSSLISTINEFKTIN